MDGIIEWVQSFLKREPAEPPVIRFKDAEWKCVQAVVAGLDHLDTPGPQSTDTEDRMLDLYEGKCFDKPKKTFKSTDTALAWMVGDLLQRAAHSAMEEASNGSKTDKAKLNEAVACFDASIKCFRFAGGILPSSHR